MLPRFDRPDKRRSDRQEKTLQLHFATRSRRAPSALRCARRTGARYQRNISTAHARRKTHHEKIDDFERSQPQPLGVREPHIYATTTFAQIAENCAHHAAGFGLDRTFRQSNQADVICGLEPYGYVAAMHALAQMEKKSCSEPIRNPPDEIGFLLVIALAFEARRVAVSW